MREIVLRFAGFVKHDWDLCRMFARCADVIMFALSFFPDAALQYTNAVAVGGQ